MLPRRETYVTPDGHHHTLWADIDDIVETLMPYWSKTKERRRERSWMFRGHTDAQWDLVPTLFRPPLTDPLIRRRQDYTERFIEDLKRSSRQVGLDELSDLEYMAVAQHYGLYTSLLDFTWNLEVAAYFATTNCSPGQKGAIYCFNAKEYVELRNPFSMLGLSVQESDALLEQHDMKSLPDLEVVELHGVPRIYQQEGVFVCVPMDKVETLQRGSERRFFRQRSSTYVGGFQLGMDLLPDRSMFDTIETYNSFVELARTERPELFERTDSIDEPTLFPPADPIAKFAKAWRAEHPDDTDSAQSSSATRAPRLTTEAQGSRAFSSQIESYYYGDFAHTPYKKQYLLTGREIVESLAQHHELDRPGVQRWLLWELLNRNLPSGLRCTLKLGDAETWGGESGCFHIALVDRWLTETYQYSLSFDNLREGPWRVAFGTSSEEGHRVADVSRRQSFVLPELDPQIRAPIPANPHEVSRIPHVLHTVEALLTSVEPPVVDSFLYDFHHIVLASTGRELELTLGSVDSTPCFQVSPLTRPEHANGLSIVVRVADHITGGTTHTAVCANHRGCMSEGDIDLMRPAMWTVLGLA